MSFSLEKPLPETAATMHDLVKRAFTAGELTCDVITCLVFLRGLDSLPNLQSVVNHNLSMATKEKPYKPSDIMRLLENEQRLRDSGRSAASSLSTALTARANPSAPTCSNCKKQGHTADYCIAQGGGMAGKSLDESRRAQREAKLKGKKSSTQPNKGVSQKGKQTVTMTYPDGRTFIAYIDNNDTAPEANSTEFAGLASVDGHTVETSDDLSIVEYDGWLALEEEKASIDWNDKSRIPDLAALSITPDDCYSATALSLETHPFYCDTGATVHISPEKSDFYNLRPVGSSRVVKGVGGSSISAIGIGDIKLRIARGAHLTLKDVLYIPASTVRLISISTLTRDSRVRVTFGDDEDGCWIHNKSTGALITRGRLTSKNLYSLNLQSAKVEHAYPTLYTPSLETWHRRLGHANYQSIMDMIRNGTISGAPVSTQTPPKCDSCILGKQTETPVPKRRKADGKATRRLEKVWVDLSGPMDVKSVHGNYYIMNVIDDFSSYLWSIPLKTKDQAYPELRAWELARENETGTKVGTYRTDNGELKTNEMATWLKSRGVNHEYSAPHTSAHIGRVERLHRTLMGKAVSMRSYAKLPPTLWDEFYLTAAHLHAKTTTHALKGTTPFELWYKKKPDYSYMREIGCRAFVLIQNKHNPKIYERSIECALIGYDAKSKTYRCYHKPTGKIISSYHVQFIESHHGHQPELIKNNDAPETPHQLPVAPSGITQNQSTIIVSTRPVQHDDSDDCLPNAQTAPAIPVPPINALEPLPEQLHDAPPPVIPDEPVPPPVPANPIIDGPRRSSRIQQAMANPPQPSRLGKAVQESRASADRVTTARKTNQPAFWEYANILTSLGMVDNEVDELLHFLWPDSDLCFNMAENLADNLPNTWDEARQSPEADKWLAAYREELKSLKDMKVYDLVPRDQVPSGQQIRKGKPVFRLKRDENNRPVRYKIRHVFKGFEQIYGRDYTKTTSPTARMESWRLIMHIAACLDWDIQQIDVKTAFLYGLLPEDEIQYMEQPRGFEEPGKESWVWKLKRSLYGMKQSGRVWNQTLNEAMLSWGFKRLVPDSCVYHRQTSTGLTIAVIHVDDFLLASSSKEENERVKALMRTKWSLSDLGEAKFCLGIAITRDRSKRTISLSQTTLIDKIIHQFGQTDANPVAVPMDPGLKLSRPDLSALSEEERQYLSKLPYRSLVGALIYLAIGTRPDIAYAVQQLSQFLDSYTSDHWNAAIRVVRYLKGTRNLQLVLGGNSTIKLLGFSDSDWANCLNTRRSIGAYTFSLGSGSVTWSVRKQKTVATSSCEAEYVAAFEAAKEALWIRQLLDAINIPPHDATTILCDNNAARSLSEDPMLHPRVKHMDIKYHFLRENVQDGKVRLQYIPSNDNVADVLTKPLARDKFTRLRGFLGLSDLPHSTTGGES